MFLMVNNRLSKVSWSGFALAAVLLTTGCNETPTATTDKKADDAATAQTTATISDEDENQEPYVMTTLGLDSVNNMVFVPLIASDKLNEEQKTCLESRDINLGQTQLQGFYRNEFTDAELKELDDFYRSEVGKKMIAYGKEEIRISSGAEVANPIAAPTPEEIAHIQSFMQTPVGAKYSQMNVAVGQGSALATLDQPIDAEFKRCNIDLTMSALMQLSPS